MGCKESNKKNKSKGLTENERFNVNKTAHIVLNVYLSQQVHLLCQIQIQYSKCTNILTTEDLDKLCRPRLDCFFRSSLIRIFPVCFSAVRHIRSNEICYVGPNIISYSK